MNFEFKNIAPFIEIADNKTYLVLINVDKRPPHLGVIINNKYFSITIKGVELGIESKAIINLIKQKKIPSILVEIKDDSKGIEMFYSKYKNLEDNTISCLTPIKEYFASSYKFNINEIAVVFDLLEKINSQEGLINCFELNLASGLDKNNNYSIYRYSFEEIEKHINNLRLKSNA